MKHNNNDIDVVARLEQWRWTHWSCWICRNKKENWFIRTLFLLYVGALCISLLTLVTFWGGNASSVNNWTNTTWTLCLCPKFKMAPNCTVVLEIVYILKRSPFRKVKKYMVYNNVLVCSGDDNCFCYARIVFYKKRKPVQ